MKRRLAICIGNDHYTGGLPELNGAIRDSDAMGEVLKNLSFEVTIKHDLTVENMGDSIGQFINDLADCEPLEAVIFYYAGHGIEIKGENLLIPTNFVPQSTSSGTRHLGYRVQDLLDQLSEYPNAVKIIILDSCRTSPDAIRGTDAKYSAIQAPKNTLIAFATSPGESARERNGGIYTKKLLEFIQVPREPVETVFKKVRQSMAGDFGGQIPWEHSSLIDDFQLNPGIYFDSISYSANALADSAFSCPDDEIKDIIDKLKSYNWYIQEDGIKKLRSITEDTEEPDELLVLGRNLYQAACGNSWASKEFISSFASWDNLSIKSKCHILNGMAYEIYYNSKNELREIFKSSYYSEILSLLNHNDFLSCKNYITSLLKCIPERVVYYPSVFERDEELQFKVELSPYNSHALLYEVSNIKLNGRDIEVKPADEGPHMKLHPCSSALEAKQTIRTIIAKSIIAPLDSIDVTIINLPDYNVKNLYLPSKGYILKKA